MSHYEYITTRALINHDERPFGMNNTKEVVQPEGEGWEYLDSCANNNFIYWNWRRINTNKGTITLEDREPIIPPDEVEPFKFGITNLTNEPKTHPLIKKG